MISQWAKSAKKKQSKYSAIIVKSTLLQAAFSAIFPTGYGRYYSMTFLYNPQTFPLSDDLFLILVELHTTYYYIFKIPVLPGLFFSFSIFSNYS